LQNVVTLTPASLTRRSERNGNEKLCTYRRAECRVRGIITPRKFLKLRKIALSSKPDGSEVGDHFIAGVGVSQVGDRSPLPQLPAFARDHVRGQWPHYVPPRSRPSFRRLVDVEVNALHNHNHNHHVIWQYLLGCFCLTLFTFHFQKLIQLVEYFGFYIYMPPRLISTVGDVRSCSSTLSSVA